MTEEEKQPYYDMYDQDKIRYDNQMKEFNQTGHWTMENGTNSKDCKEIII